jgi:hypothetical protein
MHSLCSSGALIYILDGGIPENGSERGSGPFIPTISPALHSPNFAGAGTGITNFSGRVMNRLIPQAFDPG